MPRKSLSAIGRAMAVCAALARHRTGTTFTVLKKSCGSLPAPTLSRLLKALMAEGLVAKSGSGANYVLGEKFIALAKLASGALSPADAIRPVIEALTVETGESTAFFRPSGAAIELLVKIEQPESFHFMAVGRKNRNIGANGFGQVCLAYMDTQQQKSIISSLENKPAIPLQKFVARLNKIREEKFFFENSEAKAGVIRFAAPVFTGENGAFAGVLGIAVIARSIGPLQKENFKKAVMDAARRASVLLQELNFT